MTKVSTGQNPAQEAAFKSLAGQPVNSTKGFDITKIDKADKATIEALIATNDLSVLSAQQKVAFIKLLCESLGLNPLSRPLQFVEFNDPDFPTKKKLTVYATKDCAEQLRKIHRVSVYKLEREIIDNEIVIYTAYAKDGEGREDISTGVTSLMTAGKQPYQGQPGVEPRPLSIVQKTNAIMKAETKAKRRVTLSICGLGFLDETAIEDLLNPVIIPVDVEAVQQQSNEAQKEIVGDIQSPAAFILDAPILKAIDGAKTAAVLDDVQKFYLQHVTSPEGIKALADAIGLAKEQLSRNAVRSDTEAAAKA